MRIAKAINEIRRLYVRTMYRDVFLLLNCIRYKTYNFIYVYFGVVSLNHILYYGSIVYMEEKKVDALPLLLAFILRSNEALSRIVVRQIFSDHSV